jgi:sRNA-binding regulator protein Hfq
MPQKIDLINKQVRIFLKTGLSAEGIVSSWSNEQVILQDVKSNNLLIIYDPQENIIMIHVIINAPKEQNALPKEQSEKSVAEVFNKIRKDIKDPDPDILKLDDYEPDPTLRFKKLAELRQEQLLEHKKSLQRHLTSWRADGAKTNYDSEDYYGSPNFIKHSSSKKDDRSVSSDASKLPGMQRKSSKT